MDARLLSQHSLRENQPGAILLKFPQRNREYSKHSSQNVLSMLDFLLGNIVQGWAPYEIVKQLLEIRAHKLCNLFKIFGVDNNHHFGYPFLDCLNSERLEVEGTKIMKGSTPLVAQSVPSFTDVAFWNLFSESTHLQLLSNFHSRMIVEGRERIESGLQIQDWTRSIALIGYDDRKINQFNQ
ncbi:hypothetical protein B9Z55_025224 [Caenorhabditis nigoni]|uniref:Uncharacterized protein n=1 Tax=Caenorhabditis nigoni TaxID=1611254 RepID=A0A2G5SYA4_9PELO|nr:hypothetical protein B9Z55_025224 [Caenorhabditis nigoni]